MELLETTGGWILCGSALLAAMAYWLLIPKLPYRGDFALKSFPILVLAVLAFGWVPGTAGQLLGVGLLLSAGGDVSLSFKTETSFLVGLSFFLLAHLLYMAAFSLDMAYDPGRLPWMLGLGLFAVVMGGILWPRLGKMRLPVMVYLTVILGMGICAAVWQGPSPMVLILGALIFMLSDAMIAIGKFVRPVAWGEHFIMATYYAGQALILFSHFG